MIQKGFLKTQLKSVASCLILDGYDFEKKGTTFTFKGSDGQTITVLNSWSEKERYKIEIIGAHSTISYTHHKSINQAYFSYMLRQVHGSLNLCK